MNKEITTAELVPFYVGRSLVSGALSLAMIASPDILFVDVASRDPAAARAISAAADSLSAVVRLASTPLSGLLIDEWGRRPTLVLACVVSGLSRLALARWPNSSSVYIAYRAISAASFFPIMSAAAALVADQCGGRNERYTTAVRRMFMLLAVVRAVCSRAGGAAGLPASTLIGYSGLGSLAAALTFYAFVSELPRPEEKKKETVAKKKTIGDIVNVYRSSLSFFAQSEQRMALAVLLVCRSMPLLVMAQAQDHYRESFRWGVAERSRLLALSDAAQCLVPLIVVDTLKWVPQPPAAAAKWSMRLVALSFLNTALTQQPQSAFVNPLLENLVSAESFVNGSLAKIAAKEGHGQIEAALALLEFPLSFAMPYVFKQLPPKRTDLPLLIVAAATLVGSEFAIDNVLRSFSSAVSK